MPKDRELIWYFYQYRHGFGYINENVLKIQFCQIFSVKKTILKTWKAEFFSLCIFYTGLIVFRYYDNNLKQRKNI